MNTFSSFWLQCRAAGHNLDYLEAGALVGFVRLFCLVSPRQDRLKRRSPLRLEAFEAIMEGRGEPAHSRSSKTVLRDYGFYRHKVDRRLRGLERRLYRVARCGRRRKRILRE